MSQSSQGSNVLSQETLQMLFNDTNSVAKRVGLDQSSQGFADYRAVPLDVQYSDSNEHENFQMTLEAISVIKSEFEGIPCTGNHYPEGVNSLASFDNPSPNLAASSYSNTNDVTRQEEHPSNSIVGCTDIHTSPLPLILSNVDMPGNFAFDIGFEEEFGMPTKSTPWTYSMQLKKLFVKMRVKVPLRIKFKDFPGEGYYVRAVVVYKQPEYYKEVIERCPNHVTRHKDGHCAPLHLMRCENTATIYKTCPQTGRHYMIFPVSAPQAGQDYFTEMFVFMCFSSCPGGLNRRPSIVIFSLENSTGKVFGRKVLNVRICACPGRDRINEENTESKRRNQSNGIEEPITPPAEDILDAQTEDVRTADSPSCSEVQQSTPHEYLETPKLAKKRSNPMMTTGVQISGLSFNPCKKIKKEEDNEIFTINVRGREKYEILLKIKESLDLMDMVPQAQVDAYRRSCLPCGPLSRTPQAAQTAQSSPHSESQKSNDSQECSDSTPPSQFALSQLSSASSGSAHSVTLSQGSQSGGEINAIRFTLKRTVSLEKANAK